MRGKNKCKILRQIRQRIAEENDIPLITKDCTYQGECSGTCPRCEAELRYLEQQLARRQAVGKAVTVAALSVSLMAGAVGCGGATAGDPVALEGDVPYVSAPDTTEGEKKDPDELQLLPDGTERDTSGDQDEPAGAVPAPSEAEIVELEGDVAYIPDPTETVEEPYSEEEISEAGMLETVGDNG